MSQSQYNVRMINHDKTMTFWCLINEIEESNLPEFINLTSNINRLLGAGWSFYIVTQVRGRCYFDKKIITIPEWAIKRSNDYTLYYLAHEVAHTLGSHQHDASFMRDFMFLCPEYLQHFEINYKPEAAMEAGIMPEDF